MKQSWEFASDNAEECRQLREAFYAAVDPLWENAAGAIRRQCMEIRAPLFSPWDVQRDHGFVCYAYMSQGYGALKVGVVVDNLHHAHHQDVLRLVNTLGAISSNRIAV